jgi:hypothetical protein
VKIADPNADSADIEASKSRSYLRIGGVSLEFTGNSSTFVVPPTLVMFNVGQTIPNVSVSVEWVRGLHPTQAKGLFDSGSTWKLFELGSHLQFDFYVGMSKGRPYKRLVTDKRFTVAQLQMSEEANESLGFSAVALDYPLDELLIMHRLTQEKAIELHGTGIVRANGDANLFVGHSGAGKSTTTRLWTDVEDVEVLSDDRIIVRRDEASAKNPGNASRSACELGVLRLRDCSASPTKLSAQDDNAAGERSDQKHKMRMYGTPWHGEAMFASPNSAPLTRIFVLEHGHGNIITPLTPSQAVAELFARSFVPFHGHEYVDSALVFLEELANSVPVYRYSFEPNQQAVDKVRQFRD